MIHEEKFLHKRSLHNKQSSQDHGVQVNQVNAFHFENTKSYLDCNTFHCLLGFCVANEESLIEFPNFEYLMGGPKESLELGLDDSNLTKGTGSI